MLATASTVAIVCGGWGSPVSAPAYAPTQALLVAAVDAPRVPAVGQADADVVLLAAQVLPEGLALPRGVVASDASRTYADGELRGWETSVDLGPVSVADALRCVRDDLAAQGFSLRTGSHDVFGARQRDGRWEIVVARVEHHGRADAQRDVLTVGIGSRPA